MSDPDAAQPDPLVELRLTFNDSALEWACRALDAWTLDEYEQAKRYLDIARTARLAAQRVPIPD